MSIELALDLNEATVSDLAVFLQAVEATGTPATTAVHLEGSTLKLTAASNPGAQHRAGSASHQGATGRSSAPRTPSAETQALQWLADRINEFRPNER